jgi:hypothetical protein
VLKRRREELELRIDPETDRAALGGNRGVESVS